MKKSENNTLEMMKLSKKKILLEIDENNKYYDFIEKIRDERELSFTACVKHLLFDRIDDLLERETQISRQSQIIDNINNNQNIEVEEIKEEKPKKDMLKNLNRLKQ